jgi:hypothetical protein
MTRDQDIDIEHVLDRWFTEGPTQMPDRFLDDTLDRINRAPQHRLARLQTRLLVMNRYVRLAATAAVIVVMAGFGTAVLTLTGGVGSAPSAGSGLLPTSGQAEWRPVGTRQHPTLSGGISQSDLDIVIEPTTITIFEWHGDVRNSASLVGADRLDLRMLNNPVVQWPVAGGTEPRTVWHCHVGDAGTYTYRLSSGGRHLSFTPVSDACTERATILAGDWVLTDLGDLQPGRHEATDFRPFSYGTTGRLAYTVPDGWAGGAMKNGLFGLRRPTGSDSAGITLISNAYASDQVAPCNVNGGAVGVGRTPEDLTNWLRTLPGLVVSAPTEVTIGGLRGITVDLSMAPDWTPTCDAGLYTFSLSGSDGGDWSNRLRLTGTTRARYILLDRGDGSSLVIEIEAPAADWDTFLKNVQPVLDGLEFIP